MRVVQQQQQLPGTSSANSAAAAATAPHAVDQQASEQQQQQQQADPDLLLPAGEALWADSDGGQLFSSAVVEQGHLAPLTWYLQHGQLPAALTAVNMR